MAYEEGTDRVRLLPLHSENQHRQGHGGGGGGSDDAAYLLPFEELRPHFEDQFARVAQRNNDLPPTQQPEAQLRSAWICLCKARTSRGSVWRSLSRKWTADIGGGYSHIELALISTDTKGSAWTVDFHDPAKQNSGKVRLYELNRGTSYPAEYWDVFQIGSLTPAELIGLNAYCYRQRGKPMNGRGLYANLPLFRAFIGQPKVEESSYFCSQLIVSALKYIRPESFAAINPRRCTPAQLRDILEANRDLFRTGDTFRPVVNSDSSY